MSNSFFPLSYLGPIYLLSSHFPSLLLRLQLGFFIAFVSVRFFLSFRPSSSFSSSLFCYTFVDSRSSLAFLPSYFTVLLSSSLRRLHSLIIITLLLSLPQEWVTALPSVSPPLFTYILIALLLLSLLQAWVTVPCWSPTSSASTTT